MESDVRRVVHAGGQRIVYHLEQKKVKNINLRIRRDGSVHVSASESVTAEEADRFVCSKAAFTLRAVKTFRAAARYQPGPKRYISGETFCILGRPLRLRLVQEKAQQDSISSDGVYLLVSMSETGNFEQRQRLVLRYLDSLCRAIFSEILDILYTKFEKYGVEKPQLRLRSMNTRWGSCLHKKGIITLNKRLLEAPRHCIEYVIMHELCHLLYPNHSRQFYTFLTMLMPNWRKRKEQLDRLSLCGA